MYICYDGLSKKTQKDLRDYEEIFGPFNGSYSRITGQIVLSPNCFVFSKTSNHGKIKNNKLSDGVGKCTIIFYNEGKFSEYSQVYEIYKNGYVVSVQWDKKIEKITKAVKKDKSIIVSFLTAKSTELVTFFVL